MPRFCPSCGVEVSAKETFCRNCKKTEVTYKDIHVVVSPQTKKFLLQNKWKPYTSVAEAIAETMKSSVKAKAELHDIAGPKKYPGEAIKDGQSFELMLTIKADKQYMEVPATIEAKPSPGIMAGTYFEGMLQIRNADDERIQAARKVVQEHMHIAKEVPQAKGVDFYISPKKALQSTAKKLISSFGGVMQASPQLFTRNSQTSKDVYRVNVLLTFPDVAKGDIMREAGKLYEILHVGKAIKVRCIQDGKMTSMPSKPFEQVKTYTTTVVRARPHIEVLHPLTFQNERTRNDMSVQEGERVVVALSEGIWLIRTSS